MLHSLAKSKEENSKNRNLLNSNEDTNFPE